MQVKATYKDISKVAWPVIIGSMAQAILNLIDTVFLGRVDELTLAAAAIGITFYLTFTLLCMGMAVGVQVIIARRTGEGDHAQVGYVFDQGQYLLFTFGLFLFLIMRIFAPTILSLTLSSEKVYAAAIDFLNIRSFGVLFVSLNMVYRALYIGLSNTKVLVYTTFLMAVINIVLDYLLIFGKGPFPEMGIKGAALASVVAEAFALIFFISFTRFAHNFRKYSIYSFQKLSFDIISRIVRISYPMVFQNFFSIASWFVFFILIEKSGEDQLAASNVIRSLLLLMMFPVWGLAATANTMVSNLLGQNLSSKLPLLLKRIYLFSVLWILLFGLIIIINPSLLLQIVTDEAHLIILAQKPFYVLYMSMFIFIPGVLLLHTLIGTGDTRAAFIIEIMAIVVYLTHTYLAAIVYQLELTYIWASEFSYWGVVCLLCFIRLKSRKWKKIVV